ncbi:MAG: hypothetical protein KDH94_00605 [Coxiellaceae bacterium]|nr:hypothetical protein [Coxiellaceae bacterium]
MSRSNDNNFRSQGSNDLSEQNQPEQNQRFYSASVVSVSNESVYDADTLKKLDKIAADTKNEQLKSNRQAINADITASYYVSHSLKCGGNLNVLADFYRTRQELLVAFTDFVSKASEFDEETDISEHDRSSIMEKRNAVDAKLQAHRLVVKKVLISEGIDGARQAARGHLAKAGIATFVLLTALAAMVATMAFMPVSIALLGAFFVGVFVVTGACYASGGEFGRAHTQLGILHDKAPLENSLTKFANVIESAAKLSVSDKLLRAVKTTMNAVKTKVSGVFASLFENKKSEKSVVDSSNLYGDPPPAYTPRN